MTEYQGRFHYIKKIRNKLSCDCNNDIFVGIPFYHIVAVFVKSEIDYNLLDFNKRWTLSFYNEEANPFDPSDLSNGVAQILVFNNIFVNDKLG